MVTAPRSTTPSIRSLDVATTDGRDLAVFPGGQDAAFDVAFDYRVRSIVRLVALEPFVGHGGEAFGLSRPLMLGAFALVDCGAGVAPCALHWFTWITCRRSLDRRHASELGWRLPDG